MKEKQIRMYTVCVQSMRPLVVIVYVNRKLAREGLLLDSKLLHRVCVCLLALLLTTLSVLYAVSAYIDVV